MSSSIDLPWELWIKVLSFLNEFAALTNFSQSSKRNREIVDRSSSLLYRHISVNIGYAEACTFGSATTVYPDPKKHGSSGNFVSEVYLSQTVNRQNTMMKSAFKDVKNWKDFAKARHQIEKNWRSGNGRWTTACLSLDLRQIWRFKHDPEYNYWACITLGGQLEVVSTIESNHCRRWFARPTSLAIASCTHLESSGPFILTNLHADCFLVWERIDESFENGNLPSLDEPWPNKRTNVDHGAGVFLSEMHDSAPMFRFHRAIRMPTPAFCFKARAPYLAAGSNIAQRVYVWDLHTGKLVEEYDAHDRDCDEMTYIDFDSDFVFLASSECINVFDRKTRQKIFRIPPEPVYALEYYTEPTSVDMWPHGTHSSARELRARTSLIPQAKTSKGEVSEIFYNSLTEWVAVHYDYKSGHLVALSELGYLIWTPRYRPAFLTEDTISSRMDFVVLYVGGTGHNLCVENGRAVFVTAPHSADYPFESLYALELKSWLDHSEFLENSPKLTIIETVVPSCQRISRIEMDCGAIYVTATGKFLDPTTPAYKAWRILKRDQQFNPRTVPPCWFDLDGKSLGRALAKGGNNLELPPSEEEFNYARSVWVSQANYSALALGCTSVIAYSFAENPPTEEALHLKWGR